MPISVDGLDFLVGASSSDQPSLLAPQPNQLALQNGSLTIDPDREILFTSNGQLRSRDGTHRLVFNPAANLLELHELGDIRFLTGGPVPDERLRIQADGKIGIGTASPAHTLDVNGDLHVSGTLTARLAPNLVGPDQLSAEVSGRLVTGGDGHDHTNGQGAQIRHSSLALDGGNNPHGTTAADVGALPLTGGALSGDLTVNGLLTATLAPNLVGTTQLADGAVVGTKLGAGAVGVDHLADGSVTAAKLALGAVGADQLADGAVSTAKLANGSTGTAQLADEAVTTANLANGSVTAAKLGVGAVGAGQLDPDVSGRLVTAGDGHDHTNAHGAQIKHSTLARDDGRNPHGTRAADVGALPLAGGAVNGNLIVNAALGIGTANPTHRFHVVAADAVGLFESSGTQAFLRLTTREGLNNRVEITNRPGGRLSLSTAAGGDAFNITRDGDIGIGTIVPATTLHVRGNRIRLTKIVNAAHILDVRADGAALDIESQGADLFINNNNFKVHVRNLVQQSSRDLKENVTILSAEAAQTCLESLNAVSFNYKGDPADDTRLGFIAEDCPDMVTTEDKKAVLPMSIIALLSKIAQEQQRRIAALERELELFIHQPH